MKSGTAVNCILRSMALAACALAFALPACAAPGSTGASFLRFTPSPRATGMGESHAAVSRDAYSVYWNPAGLAGVEAPELSAMYNSSFEDVDNQYMAIAYPLEYGSTLGIGISRLSVASFPSFDSIGVRTGTTDSYGMSVGVSYGRIIFKDEIERPLLNAGAGLKYISSRLDKASASSFALDLGAQYSFRPARYWLSRIPAQELRLGLALRNLGPGLKYDSGPTPLPTALSLGGAWLLQPKGETTLTVSADIVSQAGDGLYAALGAEFAAFKLLSFRAGYRTGEEAGPGVRAGVGFHLAAVDVDYSMSPFGELGSMHKLGLTARFGEPKAAAPLAGEVSRASKAKLIAPNENIEKLREESEELLGVAARLIKERRYLAAQGEMRKAFNLRPELRKGPWGDREIRLESLVKGLLLRDIAGREELLRADTLQAATAAEAMSAYIERAELKAFLLAHAAFGENQRGPAVFEDVRNIVAGLCGMSVRPDESLPKAAMIQRKLNASADAFKRKQFQTAARECEEILLLDPSMVLAWKRLGSAYFALNDMEQAKRAYTKVLELAPEDASVRRFMELKGW